MQTLAASFKKLQIKFNTAEDSQSLQPRISVLQMQHWSGKPKLTKWYYNYLKIGNVNFLIWNVKLSFQDIYLVSTECYIVGL
jgi:hypothetical protein